MALKSTSAWFLLVLQLSLIVIFASITKYGPDADATHFIRRTESPEVQSQTIQESNFDKDYPIFQDINILVFVGIGLLYAFLGKYSYTGIGMNFLLCAICVQWGIITQKWWMMENGKIYIDIRTLCRGEFAAASGVIALGAIFGKVGLLQMTVFVLIEVLVYSASNHFRKEYLLVADVGESVALHLFAATFGCSAACAVDWKRKVERNSNERSSYTSNIFCIFGTILLWCYWPSFNAIEEDGDSRYRIVINTFFALMGSAITCFATSALLDDEDKFIMSHIQNGALAGAVAIGSTVNLMIQPFGALLIGSVGGCLCVAGFKYFSPFLAKFGIYDPCGINSLHGLPGFFAGIMGVFATFMANKGTYGRSLYKIYPAMAPLGNGTLFNGNQNESEIIKPGFGRTLEYQCLYQLLYILVTIAISSLSGLLTGILLRMKVLNPTEEKYMYLDDLMWKLPATETDKEDSETRIFYSTF